MKRIIGAVAVLTVAVLLAQPARAQVEAVPLGGFQWRSGVKAYIQPKVAGDGLACTGQLGLLWSEPVTVYSLSVEVFNDPTDRAVPDVVRVYTSRFEYTEYSFTAAAAEGLYGTYVLNFPGGIQANHSYLMVVAYNTSLQVPGDGWIGVYPDSIHADAVSQGKGADVNVNAPANGVLKSIDFLAGTLPPQYGDNPLIAVDGLVYSSNAVVTNALVSNERDAIYFDGPTSERYQAGNAYDVVGLTATYRTPQTIGSVGLGFSGDAGDRALPEVVTLIGTYENGETTSMNITIQGEWIDGQWVVSDATQYARYALDNTFADIVSLTFQFELPAGNYGFIGVTEFQAFARPVPEPATMSLLALSGLALLRRR